MAFLLWCSTDCVALAHKTSISAELVLLLRVILRERRLDNELSQQIGPARRTDHSAPFKDRNLFYSSAGESFEEHLDIIGQCNSHNFVRCEFHDVDSVQL